MAARFIHSSHLMNQIIDDQQLDPVREHARRGEPREWSVHVRRIYAANARTILPDGSLQQVIHESDFLCTPSNEIYFVQAIFGIEYAINIGGPHVDGYSVWLNSNGQASPLYAPTNIESHSMPTEQNSGS